jgi:hypothetical protein
MHVLRRPRTLRKPTLALLALLLALTAAQVGLMPSAAAEPRPENKHCPYPGAIETQTLQDGTKVEWICKRFFAYANNMGEYWEWEFSRMIPGPHEMAGGTRNSSSPPYIMRIRSAVAKGVGGGDAVGAIWIHNPSGTALNRRIAVHTIMEYAPTPTSSYINCHDLGWVEAPTQRHFWWNAVKQHTQPDCGTGYYRAQVAGRFLATSTNTWQTSGWHYSPAVYLVCTDPTCQ